MKAYVTMVAHKPNALYDEPVLRFPGIWKNLEIKRRASEVHF